MIVRGSSIPRGARLGAALMLAATAGCGGTQGGSGFPTIGGPSSLCRVSASQSSLLVTEWPAAEKANLEAMASSGAVAVELSGCAMRLLPDCRIGGTYAWQPTTPSTDMIEIRSESELYAKLPLGAVSLSGELRRSGTLYVETTVAGQVRLQGVNAAMVPSTPECARATHVVDAVSLGAFVLSAAAEQGVKGGAEFRGVGAGASSNRSAQVVRYAGRAESCASATAEELPSECASPIQVFLSAIPGRAEPQAPPGFARADFVSADATTRWDVYVDDQATCTTPCARWVDPSRPLVLRQRDGADKLRVGRIDADQSPLQVVAHPTQTGRFITGLTFTALGGIAVATGIVLTSVGCGDDDREKMCNAGLITGGVGIPVTLGAIWLMRSALPKVRVRPIFRSQFSLWIGPGFVDGTF